MLFAFLQVIMFVGIPLLVVAVLVIAFYSEKKRREEIQKIAQDMGLEFDAQADPSLLGQLSDFHLMSQGRRRKISNVVHGDTDEMILSVFDYQFTVGSGKNSSTKRQTVAFCRSSQLVVPLFSLRPQHFFHNIGKMFGYKDIDFESHPVFSKQFLLRAERETEVRQLFSDDVLRYFESNLGLCCEGRGDTFIVYTANRRSKPAEFQALLKIVFPLHRLFCSEQDSAGPGSEDIV